MYAWAHAWSPANPDYDLDNSLNFQVYIPDKRYAQKHLDAIRAVWGTYMVRQGRQLATKTRSTTTEPFHVHPTPTTRLPSRP